MINLNRALGAVTVDRKPPSVCSTRPISSVQVSSFQPAVSGIKSGNKIKNINVIYSRILVTNRVGSRMISERVRFDLISILTLCICKDIPEQRV